MNQTSLSPAVLAFDNYSYREREWRAPAVPEGATIIFDEPGRVLDNVCYRSHYFRVFKEAHGLFYHLTVQHGAGTESWRLGYNKRVLAGLAQLDSDTRYLMLHTIMDSHQESETRTKEKVSAFWRQAAAEKRIKTRKVKDGVKVWIEDKVA